MTNLNEKPEYDEKLSEMRVVLLKEASALGDFKFSQEKPYW